MASTGPPRDRGGRLIRKGEEQEQVYPASTGPPRDRGGRDASHSAPSYWKGKLQRGRLVIEAEGTRCEGMLGCPPFTLQRGRLVIEAEGRRGRIFVFERA